MYLVFGHVYNRSTTQSGWILHFRQELRNLRQGVNRLPAHVFNHHRYVTYPNKDRTLFPPEAPSRDRVMFTPLSSFTGMLPLLFIYTSPSSSILVLRLFLNLFHSARYSFLVFFPYDSIRNTRNFIRAICCLCSSTIGWSNFPDTTISSNRSRTSSYDKARVVCSFFHTLRFSARWCSLSLSLIVLMCFAVKWMPHDHKMEILTCSLCIPFPCLSCVYSLSWRRYLRFVNGVDSRKMLSWVSYDKDTSRMFPLYWQYLPWPVFII